VALAPDSYYTSQISGTGFDPTALFEPDGPFGPAGTFEHRPEGPQVLKEPDNYFENQFAGPRMRAHAASPEAPAERVVASPFLSAMERVDLTALSEVAPRSLFSTPGAQARRRRVDLDKAPPAQQ
jgi:hypothetical protein